jgi:mRNA interferase MazF
MPTCPDLEPGAIVWAHLHPAVEREQGGRRPVLVIASRGYLDVIDRLALVVPITTVDRGWPNHVPLSGLPRPSFAMTEQLRAVSRSRLHGRVANATQAELARAREWITQFISEPDV